MGLSPVKGLIGNKNMCSHVHLNILTLNNPNYLAHISLFNIVNLFLGGIWRRGWGCLGNFLCGMLRGAQGTEIKEAQKTHIALMI